MVNNRKLKIEQLRDTFGTCLKVDRQVLTFLRSKFHLQFKFTGVGIVCAGKFGRSDGGFVFLQLLSAFYLPYMLHYESRGFGQLGHSRSLLRQGLTVSAPKTEPG